MNLLWGIIKDKNRVCHLLRQAEHGVIKELCQRLGAFKKCIRLQEEIGTLEASAYST